jgi:hypothetical protein
MIPGSGKNEESMPDNLITLTCPNCGGKLQALPGDEHYVCSHCGTELRVNGSPAIAQLQQNVTQMQATLQDINVRTRSTEAAQVLPGLIASLAHISQRIQENGRVLLTSLVVLGFGFFLSRVLIFSSDSGLIRYLPTSLLAIGGGAFFFSLYRLISLLGQHSSLEDSIRRYRDRL